MHLPEFALERWFARWEFACRHVLCASDVEPYRLDELLALADDDARARWSDLRLGYTETPGLPALRREIASLYDSVESDDVLAFAGAEEAIFVAMHVLLEPGDHVVVAWPAYQSLFEVARAVGADVALAPLDPADWSLDPDRVTAAMRPNTRLVVANVPHSPTGALLPAEAFQRLVAITERHGARLLMDEVYRYLEYDPAERLPAAVDASPLGVSIGVMSKAFALAGLRVGWIASRDRALLRRMAAFKDYTSICNSAPGEVLALIALRSRERVLDRSRRIIAGNLALAHVFFARQAGRVRWVPPRGGSVAFPELLHGDVDSFAGELVRSTGVLLLPGSLFGYPGAHFRLGLGRTDFPEGLARLESFLVAQG